MKLLFSILFQVMMIAGMVGMGYLIFKGVISTAEKLDRMLRWVAVAAGIAMYGAVEAMGVSLINLITTPIDRHGWLGFVASGILLPSLTGLVCAAYVVRCARYINYLNLRLILFVGTFILVLYIELYVNTIVKDGLQVTQRSAPNLIFLATFGLYFSLKFEKPPTEYCGPPPDFSRLWSRKRRK